MNPIALSILLASTARAAYYPLYDFSGPSFFNDGFDFYGAIDNTTWGNVSYVTAAAATAESLAYVNAAGNAVFRVDNTTDVLNTGDIQYRKSVRLTSKVPFDVGTLFVIDAKHMPYGCSVWPSIWFNGVLEEGQEWPAGGEMDLVEAINLMQHNQMALHSHGQHCVQPQNVTQVGQSLKRNCTDPTGAGCMVAETKANSYGKGFNDAGGGAFAMQFDQAGIFMWFWSRPDIPASIQASSDNHSMEMTLTDWGTPSAAFPAAGCNISEEFAAQYLVFTITLCGLWAGIPEVYGEDCNGTCFSDQIAGNGSNYANAFFEIPFVRTWTPNPAIAANAAAAIANASASASAARESASQAWESQMAGQTGAAAQGALKLGVACVVVLLGLATGMALV
ncbi:GH16 domain-containing protein [Mycena kentingensis (nom. inval.)]|nr:GH16 domain-containing protein [Mycena kentingensis (nom. inval.)]